MCQLRNNGIVVGAGHNGKIFKRSDRCVLLFAESNNAIKYFGNESCLQL